MLPLSSTANRRSTSLFWCAVLTLVLVHTPTTTCAYSFHASTSRQSLSILGSTTPLLNSFPPSKHSKQQHSLCMHMGHSHAHHHHDHHQEQSTTAAATAAATVPPKTLAGRVKQLSQRPIVRLVFAALVVFVPAMIRRQSLLLKRGDFAAFGMIAVALTFADGVRRECQRITHRVMDWKHGILKHTASSEASDNLTWLEKLSSNSREQAADRVTLVGVIMNLVLSVGKLVVGITCHSAALVADAGHSLSDLFSDFITLWAVQIARLPPDDDHPYGHGKFEAVGALFLALTLLGTGLSVGAVSNRNLMEILKLQRATGAGAAATLAATVQVPTFPALITAFISIVSKEWLYRITRRVGEDLNSQVVLANAWHHRSDAYSSILALVSIALAMLVPGLLAADSAAGLLVGGMICMTGAEILGEAVKQLTDASADESLVKKVEQLALGESHDVLGVTRIRTRQMGSKAYVDVSITTPDSLSSSAARAVEERVKRTILKHEPNIVDAEVHAKSTAPSSLVSYTDDSVVPVEPIQDYDDDVHSHSQHGAEASSATSDPLHISNDDNNVDTMNVAESSTLESRTTSGPMTATASDNTEFTTNTPTVAISSFQEVEDDARQLLNNHASIKSIEGCTVHYEEASQEVQVDVTIKLENPDWTTVTIATSLARELKLVLEEGSDKIHKANIFLDLNSSPDEKSATSNDSKVSQAVNVNGANTTTATPSIHR